MKCDEIQGFIKTAVEKIGKEKGESVTDILRALQKEAGLLFHKNIILDCLDADAFGIFEDDDNFREQVKRKINKVVSFEKCSTRDGYSSIVAEVMMDVDNNSDLESENDEGHSGCDNITLSFHFERQHVKYIADDNSSQLNDQTSESTVTDNENSGHNHSNKKRKIITGNSNNDSKSVNMSELVGTHVIYRIYLRKGHGTNEPILSVEVKASGKDPSIDEHIAIISDEDFDNDLDSMHYDNRNICEISNSELQFCGDGKDRFQALLDPEVLVKFLEVNKFEFKDVSDAVRFLLCFPHYEHEWDIVGYVEDVVIGSEGGFSACDDSMEDIDILEDVEGCISTASAA